MMPNTTLDERPPDLSAPLETGTPKQAAVPQAIEQQDYGPNNERLPEHLINALRRLIAEYKSEGQTARRDEVRRIRQAREFWKGLQYIYWSEADQSWHLPSDARGLISNIPEDEESPRYQYVTNIWQAYGLSIIAVLSQDVPRVRLWPQSPQQLEDIAAAEDGTTVIELIERNNRMQELMVQEAFYLWCDGKIGAYVRYVVDGARFGFHPEDEMTTRQVRIGEDVYLCPNCQAETPARGLLPVDLCETCGADLSEENLVKAPLVEVPYVQRTIEVPNGAEVITIVGGLELKTPTWANEQHQFPYLIWQVETHKALLRAAYPHVRKKLGAGLPSEGGQDQYERTARLGLVSGSGGQIAEGGDLTHSLITFERAWLRPWAFELLDDEALVDELKRLFPAGCYVAFAGDTYCESRNESMDDHWRVMHALPGDGQDRPALGTSLIPVQERYNTLQNIIIETAEHGIPPTYADDRLVDFDAIESQEVKPGVHYPVTVPATVRSLRDAFWAPEPARVSPDVIHHSQELFSGISQFLSGAFPALFGGQVGKTAAEYRMARDQALGRIGLVWRRMKQFHADIMLLGVDVFRKNRPADVEVPVWAEGHEFKSKWIRLANLKGNLLAYPESDEQYPTVWSQQRQVLMELLGSSDPMIQELMAQPENLDIIKRLIGLNEFVLPDAESRTKQHREIERLLAEQPTEDVDPMTGQPILVPSIMPDEFGDDHEVELAVVKRWMNSDPGQKAKEENPAGFENVRAHGMMHQRFLENEQLAAANRQAMAQMAMAGAQPAPPPVGGGPPPRARRPNGRETEGRETEGEEAAL